MSIYSQNQLNQRDIIIQSQKLLWSFLDSNMMNKLVHLFNERSKKSDMKISNFIEFERKKQGLDNSDVSIISEIYGHRQTTPSPTLYLGIKKDSKEFMHLTIHLAPNSFDSNLNGPIHFVKDVYTIKEGSKKQRFNYNRQLYAIILVSQAAHKPKSLEFSIASGYTTPGVKDPMHDQELQQEMNVIITVLNRLFDEDNAEFYIGNEDKLFPIHNNTNIVLNGINKRSNIITLKNKGTRLYPPLNKNSESINKYRLNKKSQTRVNKSERRKRRTPIIIYENNFKISMI